MSKNQSNAWTGGIRRELQRLTGARYGWTRVAGLALVALMMLAMAAMAQSTSSLNGRVTDPSGAGVPNATITLSAGASGFQRSTTSNATGLYQLLDVPPGTYRMEVKAAGFSTYVAPSIVLAVSTPSTVNVSLQVGSVTTSVEVKGGAIPLINKTDASLGNTLQQDQISELPIADRNVVQLLSLQPGVTYLGLKLDQSATDTRSGAVNGLRSDQSNVTLDGIGVNDGCRWRHAWQMQAAGARTRRLRTGSIIRRHWRRQVSQRITRARFRLCWEGR